MSRLRSETIIDLSPIGSADLPRFEQTDGDYGIRMLRLAREARARERPDHLIGVFLSEAEAESLACSMYKPQQATDTDSRACMGKGHYLCQGCAHLALSPTPDGDDL